MLPDFFGVATGSECEEKTTSEAEVMEGRDRTMGCSAIGWIDR
jgi:hypothetical protein